MSPERYEELMVKVVDGAATPAEREALMAWVLDKPELRRELEAQQALKAVTDGWVDRLQADLTEDRSAAHPKLTWGWRIGVGLLGGAYVMMACFGVLELWRDPEAPLWLTMGLSAAAIGAGVLALTAIRWRLQTAKDDPYRDIVR